MAAECNMASMMHAAWDLQPERAALPDLQLLCTSQVDWSGNSTNLVDLKMNQHAPEHCVDISQQICLVHAEINLQIRVPGKPCNCCPFADS